MKEPNFLNLHIIYGLRLILEKQDNPQIKIYNYLTNKEITNIEYNDKFYLLSIQQPNSYIVIPFKENSDKNIQTQPAKQEHSIEEHSSIDCNNSPLYIAIDNLPCQSEITDLISSKTWRQATKSQKQKLISGIISFNTVLEQYANHYENKKTPKGTFYADVLRDYYYDFVESFVGNFDDELNRYIDNDIDAYANELIYQAAHPKDWIKTLKINWQNDKEKILSGITDENGHIDLDAISDISPEYRSCFN